MPSLLAMLLKSRDCSWNIYRKKENGWSLESWAKVKGLLDQQGYYGCVRNTAKWLEGEITLEETDFLRFLTVVITISLNVHTSNTETTNDPLDRLCKKFLYPEEQPLDFRLRDVFNLIWSGFRNSLTDVECLQILIPNVYPNHNIGHAEDEAVAADMLNNTIKGSTEKLTGFYTHYSTNMAELWREFIGAFKKGYCQICQEEIQTENYFTPTDDQINRRLTDIICNLVSNKTSGNPKWTQMLQSKYWGGHELTDEICKKKPYECATAFILIAIANLEGGSGDASPIKRKAFQKALTEQIVNDFFGVKNASEKKDISEMSSDDIVSSILTKPDCVEIIKQLVEKKFLGEQEYAIFSKNPIDNCSVLISNANLQIHSNNTKLLQLKKGAQ